MKCRGVFGLTRSFLLSAVAAPSVLLAGCNMVVSERPWFSSADAENAAKLKPGLWALSKCDPGNALHCTTLTIEVTGSELRRHEPNDLPAEATRQDALLEKTRVNYLVIPGDPIIIQVQMRAPPELQREPGANTTAYLGFAPTERDADGQVIAGAVWPLVCGPEPKPGDANYGLQDEQGSVTNHPLPGLTMADGFTCVANDRATLVRVARETKTMNGAPLSIHWRSPASAPGQN